MHILKEKVKIAHNPRTSGDPENEYRITLLKRKITQPNGDYTIYGGERRIVKKDDSPEYPGFPDGYFRVTGNITGNEMRNGVAFQWNAFIINPLIYKYCDFIVYGDLYVDFTNQSAWEVNYGMTRTCDDQAELTINGTTTTVTLPLEF